MKRAIAVISLLLTTISALVVMAVSQTTDEQPPQVLRAERVRPTLVADNAGFIRKEVTIPLHDQKLLYDAAQEFGVDYELALAVAWVETGWRNVTGDGGEAVGYMQLQPRWCWPEMEKLDVTDLSDPGSNFRVGCCLLAAYIEDYGVEGGLTRYNTGHVGGSEYADKVLLKWDELKGATP